MKRVRAAWFAFRNPEHYVTVDPLVIKVHAPINADVAREIRRALIQTRAPGAAPEWRF